MGNIPNKIIQLTHFSISKTGFRCYTRNIYIKKNRTNRITRLIEKFHNKLHQSKKKDGIIIQ